MIIQLIPSGIAASIAAELVVIKIAATVPLSESYRPFSKIAACKKKKIKFATKNTPFVLEPKFFESPRYIPDISMPNVLTSKNVKTMFITVAIIDVLTPLSVDMGGFIGTADGAGATGVGGADGGRGVTSDITPQVFHKSKFFSSPGFLAREIIIKFC